jgi:hypothetical protein
MGGVVRDAALYGVDEMDVGLLARVEAAPKDREAGQIAFGDAQPLEGGRAEIAFGMVERKFDFGETQQKNCQ